MGYKLREEVGAMQEDKYLLLGETQNKSDYQHLDVGENKKCSVFREQKPISNLDMILSRIKEKIAKKNNLYGWTNDFENTQEHFHHWQGSAYTDIETHTEDDPED